jgi:DNA polymerase-3 subunit alpha
MSNKPFVHLHLHTDYSLLDAASQIKPLAKRVAALEMPACAITDHGNMYGAISFYNQMKANGVKPIIGCEVYLARNSRKDRVPAAPGQKLNNHLILLAQDYEGYRNLARLTSLAYTEGFYYKPRIDKELLAQHSKGLIGLSACLSGVPASLLSADKNDEAGKAALEFQEILGKGNYFLEIQEHGIEGQDRIKGALVELSRTTGIPLVATNDAHYLTPEDARAHEVLLCIGSTKTINDPNRRRYGPANFYVKSAEEMWQIFGAELPETLHRTAEIAERCNLTFPTGVNHLPKFPIPAEFGDLSEVDYLDRVSHEGFDKRLLEVWSKQQAAGSLRHGLDEYRTRLTTELAMIRKMGFPGYFLIVWDFIRYARQNSIPVGPGRGSAAGSLVAYCLEITDIDPLQYDLLFERFLNPDRVSMPDIDIDFCVRGRGDVINHVADLYGRDSVCQIITFGTMASKAAIKDVGRVLDMPYAEVERIAKMIPPPVRGRNVSIKQAIEQVPELATAIELEPKVKELIDLAQRLEGCARHASVHAAGVVISPQPLQELVPIAVSSKDELTTQFSMNDLEQTGMLKMDFLGLTALTVISDCLKSIKQGLGVEIDWAEISLEDPKSMALFAEGKTDAIFQFESSGMQEICRKLKPKTLEDLAALNALYRPGPLDGGMVDDFIARHHGTKTVRYLVPDMKEILSNTHGILVYQEQIMQLAQKLGGYSLGEADLMRRAMGKKKREEMAKHEEKFVAGAVERKIKPETARKIFSLMAQFADYGFNRSHSVAYAYLAFQTAYLKAHYPEHFYAAVLSSEAQDAAKIFKYSHELRGLGIQLLPPDVNESGADFTPLVGAIRYGLAAIKGLGLGSVGAIAEARKERLFDSVFDFVERINPSGLNRRVIESLSYAGAFDSLKKNGEPIQSWRARLASGIESVMAHGQRHHRDLAHGQSGLFGAVNDAAAESQDDSGSLPDATPWTHMELLGFEKKAIGFYVSGHPLEAYESILAESGAARIVDLEPKAGALATVGGIATGIQVRNTKKGARFALLRLEDDSGGVKCILWPETFTKYQKLVVDEAPLLVQGVLDVGDDDSISLVVNSVEALDSITQTHARVLLLRVPEVIKGAGPDLERLQSLLCENVGDCQVMFDLVTDGLTVRLKPHGTLRVKGSPMLESTLTSMGYGVEWKRTMNGR